MADGRWKKELKRDEVRDMIHSEKVRLAGIEAIKLGNPNQT